MMTDKASYPSIPPDMEAALKAQIAFDDGREQRATSRPVGARAIHFPISELRRKRENVDMNLRGSASKTPSCYS